MRSITATFLAWLLVATAQPQAPQRPQQPAQQQQTNAPLTTKGGFKFEANTTLIVETVVVKDKDGNPIKGLKAKDFTVTEDGKPQDIKICDFQELESTPAPQELKPRPAPAAASAIDAAKPAEPATIKAVVNNANRPREARRYQVQGPPADGDVLRHDLHADPGPDPRADRRAEVPQDRR